MLIRITPNSQAPRHIKYRATLVFWDPQGVEQRESFEVRDLYNFVDALSVMLKLFCPSQIKRISLSRTHENNQTIRTTKEPAPSPAG